MRIVRAFVFVVSFAPFLFTCSDDDTALVGKKKSSAEDEHTDVDGQSLKNNYTGNGMCPNSKVFTMTWLLEKDQEVEDATADPLVPLEEQTLAAKIDLKLNRTGTYNFRVDWGDGTSNFVIGTTDSDARHTYEFVETGDCDTADAAVSDYASFVCYEYDHDSNSATPDRVGLRKEVTIKITGYMDELDLCYDNAPANSPVFWESESGVEARLVKVDSLGNVCWKSFQNMFRECEYLRTVAGGDTSKVTNMNSMFLDAKCLHNVDVSTWKTSKVTTMASMFRETGQREIDLGGNDDTADDVEVSIDDYDCSPDDIAVTDVVDYTNRIEFKDAEDEMGLHNLDFSAINEATDSASGFYEIFTGTRLSLDAFSKLLNAFFQSGLEEIRLDVGNTKICANSSDVLFLNDASDILGKLNADKDWSICVTTSGQQDSGDCTVAVPIDPTECDENFDEEE